MAKIAKRTCVNSADSFCFICGSFTTSTQRRVISENVKMLYESYFGFTIGHQDKEWAPHRCCVTCIANLSNWMNGKRSSMPFAVPMIWREPTSHDVDCYFCLTNVVGFSRKKSLKIHFLHSHLDFFPQNLGAVSDEQGERFHQDIITMEQRYQGRWDPGMLGDHCWFLMRETDLDYKRKSP